MSKGKLFIRLLIIILVGTAIPFQAVNAQGKSSNHMHTLSAVANAYELSFDHTTNDFDNKDLDTLSAVSDSVLSLATNNKALIQNVKEKIWRNAAPDPKRALWLSLVLPGAGQIYNRKYWKLPIIYGGFIGCTYALLWNQQMYKDYSQAYIDIMDEDPNTASYKDMLPMGYNIEGREEQFKNIFKHKKDYYRKYRDLSIFAFIGVYLISVVDAYVDSQLSSFDISPDLSMKLEPAVFNQKKVTGSTRSVGLQCSFTFK